MPNEKKEPEFFKWLEKCDVDGRYYRSFEIRHCSNPAVLEMYGNKRGTVRVSFWQCNRCKYAIRRKWTSAVSCGYHEEGEENGRKDELYIPGQGNYGLEMV